MASAGIGEDAVHVHLFTCCWPTDHPLLIVLDVQHVLTDSLSVRSVKGSEIYSNGFDPNFD